ncbi:MAG: DinB family protein [Chloroflexi bacterium]|nr:DinB family protein [Chloroflexota bacterium]
MVSQAATSLRDAVDQKMRELEEAVTGLSDESAARRPADGEWCAKEVLSHLLGEEGQGAVGRFRRFLDEDQPLIGIVSGLPYYTPQRQSMTVADLLAGVRAQYLEVGHYLGGLNDEQLARKARIPLFKDTPLTEYPTLAQTAGALVSFHVTDHINQIRTARERIGA